MNKIVFFLPVLVFHILYTTKAQVEQAANSTQVNSTQSTSTKANQTQPSLTQTNSTQTNSTQANTTHAPPAIIRSSSLVMIDFMDSRFCVGSLITMNHILTSHHCMGTKVPGVTSLNLKAKIGFNDTRRGYEEREVVKVIRNIGFSSKTIVNDIAILEVQPAFRKTREVYPIPLANVTTRTKCYMAGWDENGNPFNSDIKMFNQSPCNLTYRGNLPPKTICASPTDKVYTKLLESKEMCELHYGSPLICNNVLTGVMSYYSNCGFRSDPDVFTEVSKFLNWLIAALPNIPNKERDQLSAVIPTLKIHQKTNINDMIGRNHPTSVAAKIHINLSTMYKVIIPAILYFVTMKY